MKYVCPLCKTELREQIGDKLHPFDANYGITLDCPNKQCEAEEVMGHGHKAKDAFQVIVEKFIPRIKH